MEIFFISFIYRQPRLSVLNGLDKARHLDYMVLKQRRPIFSTIAFVSLVKGQEVNFHLASSIGQANRLAFHVLFLIQSSEQL